jgi:hypothetical protein
MVLMLKYKFNKVESRLDWMRLLKEKKLNNNLPHNSKKTSIDILICCTEKDVDILPFTIEGAKANIQHKIENIFLVAPVNSDQLKIICADKGVVFITEDELEIVNKRDIQYTVNGKDRSGWFYQQLIKLHADQISKNENILVLDADTVYVNPVSFFYRGKTFFDISDEYHKPYFSAIDNLMPMRVKPISFVSHFMMLNRTSLQELRKRISQKHGKPFIEATLSIVDEKQMSCFSEYELYGNYFTNNSNSFLLRYWTNKSIQKNDTTELKEIIKVESDSIIRTLSFHSYNKNLCLSE